jgi:hypothetical protein
LLYFLKLVSYWLPGVILIDNLVQVVHLATIVNKSLLLYSSIFPSLLCAVIIQITSLQMACTSTVL